MNKNNEASTQECGGITISKATDRDIDALVALEAAAFDSDKLSRRSFRRFLRTETAELRVAKSCGETVIGYSLVLHRTNTSLARLYSIAVHPSAQGQGVAKLLLSDAEHFALRHGSVVMRLEVSAHNVRAQDVYLKSGYQVFGNPLADYYEDGSSALRMHKTLLPDTLEPPQSYIYYPQTLDFTCGPAALMMALHTLDPAFPLMQRTELAIWREATTVFMTSGYGGCGPHGLALAAVARGFCAEVYLSQEDALFLNTVRNSTKREVLQLVHADFLERMNDANIPLTHAPLSFEHLQNWIHAGNTAVILISQFRLFGLRAPHWVTVTGIDETFVYVSDPDNDITDMPFSSTDCVSLPIPRREFDLMARYGRDRLQAAVLFSKAS